MTDTTAIVPRMPAANMAEYVLARYHRRHVAVIVQLGGRCARCGSEDELEIDHIDPSTKSFTVGQKLAGIAEAKLQAELAKCQLLCKPCHYAKSAGERSLTHGKYHAAYHLKCRCPECLAFRAEWNRQCAEARRLSRVAGVTG